MSAVRVLSPAAWRAYCPLRNVACWNAAPEVLGVELRDAALLPPGRVAGTDGPVRHLGQLGRRIRWIGDSSPVVGQPNMAGDVAIIRLILYC